MTTTALEQFRAKLAADAALQKACLESMDTDKEDGFVAFGRKLGFEFTAEDVRQKMDDAELSDFELELVAAGNSIDCNPNSNGAGKT